ncbi:MULTISPECIES: magnesium transporter MgtE N-terminal domain-containing protein [Micromonospora]|uniref:magnesium transporter MgtE N-terminal domain-containing protein n=1 Tax=Micromonospora TaxID=1873 RepID=UPI0007DB5E54|nr:MULTISPECIES: CBS domain-containing protein [Micromonospora]MBC8994603.1 magnesium transporter [Micromonospora chalcea]MBQ1060962.1 magnesium transporter [Micromonospora sp. C41]NHO80391.1 magnesium transporter [Micromonospora sp. CMU55-4]PPA60941.1 magnesium transporter [Micromonospora chalcea]RBQ13731.1 magnesium transporter [Micromonospora sp. LHW51205]
MSTPNRVYLARLAGVAVFDPNGDQVGRVRDAVARMRATQRPPEVVGLVAEMPMRRRIFLSINRITSIDPDGVVLGSGTLNLRRFEKRPNELLVLQELLDRRVQVEGGRAGSVVDVAMECSRGGEWTLSRVAVREHTGRLTRRGHLHQVEWDRVHGLGAVGDNRGTANLLAVLEDMRPADLANALQDLPDARRNEVAAALDDERLADVLSELPEHDQVEILAALDRQRAADVLEEMEPDDAADLLNELPPPEQDVLLDLMEPDEADPVRQLLRYASGTAGSVMTSEPVILPPDATVAEALARIREAQLSPAVAAQVFVTRAPLTTPTGRYLGMVHFQRLLREPPADLLGGIVVNDIDPLRTSTPLPEITRRMATYDMVGMPVVDRANRLVGAVTVDDVLDHSLPRDWRDRDAASPSSTTDDGILDGDDE